MTAARFRISGVLAACVILALAGSRVASGEAATTADIPAPSARLATRALLLDAANAGPRVVAVGVHGVVITSDDDGASWTQSAVPVSGMLTCVAFADEHHGWAAGHAGLLLSTTDGGLTWSRVASAATEDDSFLDLLALPGGRVLAGGAYGLYLVSDDNGRTWERKAALDEDMHINRITRGASGTLYIAAEAGVLASSTDSGTTWERMESPYEGSFYGLHEFASGRLLAHGLRGHIFVSDDKGSTWTRVDLDHAGLLATAVEVVPGTIAVSGAGGRLLISRDNGSTFPTSQESDLNATAEVIVSASGAVLGVGDGGVDSLRLPQP